MQHGPIDPGIFAHQVRATLDNRQVILVTRGHDAEPGKPEEPGSLKVFDFSDGVLSNEVSIAPGWRLRLRPAASGFPSVAALGLCLAGTAERARHVRAEQWRAVADAAIPQERAEQRRAGIARSSARCTCIRMAARCTSPIVQRDGDFAASACADGENSLAVYAIDPATGEPNLIQHIDTHGIHPRTFHIDPSGRCSSSPTSWG